MCIRRVLGKKQDGRKCWWQISPDSPCYYQCIKKLKHLTILKSWPLVLTDGKKLRHYQRIMYVPEAYMLLYFWWPPVLEYRPQGFSGSDYLSLLGGGAGDNSTHGFFWALCPGVNEPLVVPEIWTGVAKIQGKHLSHCIISPVLLWVLSVDKASELVLSLWIFSFVLW